MPGPSQFGPLEAALYDRDSRMLKRILPRIMSGKGRERRAGRVEIRRGMQAVKPGRGELELSASSGAPMF